MRLRREIRRSFRYRSLKPGYENQGNTGLLGVGHPGGEWLDAGRLERAKGFEPSTPTLARVRDGYSGVSSGVREHDEL